MINKKKCVFTIIYIIILLVVFEIVARIVLSNPILSRQFWANESISWRREWVKRHNASGNEIYFKFDIYDSMKGWETKPNIRDLAVFDNKFLNSNSIGLRGVEEYNFNKDHNTKRIMIIGDSFTFGEEVSDNETYSYYLEQLLPNSEIMNLGVHGYGHDQMLISLRELGHQYNPDFVILGFIEPDTKRNMVNFRDYAKPQFKIKKNKLKLTAVPVPTIESTLKWDWLRPRIIDIFAIIKHQIRVKSGKYDVDKAKISQAILTEIVNESIKIEAEPIFVYIPLIEEISTGDIMVSGETFLSNFCANNDNVTFFSARPYIINKGKRGTVYKEKGHWGPEGNLAIAEAIRQYLFESGLY